MKPKHTIRAIKKFARENMKEQTYYALEKTFKPFWDEESKELKVGIVKEYPVNHGRRAKRIYKKWGIQAVMAYFAVFKKENSKTEIEL